MTSLREGPGRLSRGTVACQRGLIVAVAGLLLGHAGETLAQTPPPPVAAPPAVPPPGVVGQAPIAAGNTASARERALDEAFRLLVEAAFVNLLAESGVATPSPAQTGVRASWLQRPRRLVRGYKVLEQSEQGGMLSVRVTADLDEAGMRRELERARGVSTPRAGSTGTLPVIAVGDESRGAAAAIASGLVAAGHRAEVASGRFGDEAAVRAFAAKSARGLVVTVSAREQDEGPVRGTSQRAHSCEATVRLFPSTGDPLPERSAKARAFVVDARTASSACFGRVATTLVPQVLPDIGGLGLSGELRFVMLDLDLIEPAVMSPLLRALRKVAGPASVEVRRIAVGRAEIAVSTRLTGAALLAGLTRELASVANVVRSGADRGDRVTAQIRLLAPTSAPAAPPAAGAAAATPAALPR
ncbi:MAG TPA: hypothetical protein VGG33_00135 [Polyangia bacterium]